MYYLLSLLTGVLISVMVAFNGGLTNYYGVYSATIIIHIIGLAAIFGIVLVKRERLLSERQSWFLYLGGAIGVLITVCNNLAFGRISLSAILGLGLFGQSVISLIIDQYGLMDMPRHPFDKNKIIGLLLTLCGIAYMINNFEPLAVAASFVAGIAIVVSRTFNARLADLTSVRISTLYNYVVGLVVSIPAYFLLGRSEAAFIGFSVSPNLYIYLGGIAGVLVVVLSNVTVTRVSAFYLSLLIFVGEVFSGILIDMLISQEFSVRNIVGGILVAAGMSVNLYMDNRRKGRLDG